MSFVFHNPAYNVAQIPEKTKLPAEFFSGRTRIPPIPDAERRERKDAGRGTSSKKRQKKRSRGKKGGETPRPQEGQFRTRPGALGRLRIRITLSNEHSPVQPDSAACKSPATKTASSAGVSGPPPSGGSCVSETNVSSSRGTSSARSSVALTGPTIICSMIFQKNLLFFRFFLKSSKNQCTLPL